ncbi:hypothetical protein KQI84_10870 [bacterium]|nr:hypothetical protein [bacterium]
MNDAKRRDLWKLWGVLALLALGHFVLVALGERAGMFILSGDELSRFWYAKYFTETGSFATFEYTWLPLPIWVNGCLSELLKCGVAEVTMVGNSLLCLAIVLVGAYGAWLVRSGWVAPLVGGLLALTSPWQTFASLSGFAEPFSWAGLMIATIALAAAATGGAARVAVSFVVAGIAVAVAALSRYEAWVFAPGILVGGAILLWWRYREATGASERRKLLQFGIPALAVAVLVAAAPIVFWLNLHARVHGDWTRPFAQTHWFATTGMGEASGLRTAFGLYEKSLPYNFWIPVLAIVALMKRRWSMTYAALVVPPLCHFLAMTVFSARGGVAWIYGGRLLGFHCMALAVPAGIVLVEAMKDRDAKLRMYLAGGVLAVILASQVALTLTPPEGGFERLRITRDVLQEELEDHPLAEGEKIGVPSGDQIRNGWVLLTDEQGDLLETPSTWPPILPEADAILQWIIREKVAYLIRYEPLPYHPRLKNLTRPWESTHHLKQLIERNDALLLATHGTVSWDLPVEWSEFFAERGFEGPPKGQGQYRYAALVPPKGSSAEPIEEVQVDLSQNLSDLHRVIYARPDSQRRGWPGHYIIRIEPSDYGGASVFAIGDRVVQPRRPGFVAIAFDAETGEVNDCFLAGPGNQASEELFPPYCVYKLRAPDSGD